LARSQPEEATSSRWFSGPAGTRWFQAGKWFDKAAPLDLPIDHRRMAPGGNPSRALSFSRHRGSWSGRWL